MENSIINYVRLQSLLNIGPNDHFDQFSVKAILPSIRNDGTIRHGSVEYCNKCWFIAFRDALVTIGWTDIDPYDLATSCHMLNNEMVDTNNDTHLIFLEYLAKCFDVRIEVFIGEYSTKKSAWMIKPLHDRIIGTGTNVLRIINMNKHFEHLVGVENEFIPNIADEANDSTEAGMLEQFAALKIYNLQLADYDYAQKLEKEERLLEEQRINQERQELANYEVDRERQKLLSERQKLADDEFDRRVAEKERQKLVDRRIADQIRWAEQQARFCITYNSNQEEQNRHQQVPKERQYYAYN
jgi:hypothetical protein